MKKGKRHSEESKKKISRTLKGRFCGKDNPFYSKKHSEETITKMSEAKMGHKVSKKTRTKMSETHKGKELSEEHKKSLREAMKGKFDGRKHPQYGTKHSEETKRKMSRAMEGKQYGEDNPNWQGGISFDPYPRGWNDTLRESIRERDNFVCQLCGVHQDELDRRLQVHHIDYDKDNLDPKNLVSLCHSCHIKTNHRRDYWLAYFRK